MAQQLTDEQNTIKQECRDFLETDKETAGTRKHGYAARIDELVRAGKPGRLLIDITHLNGKVQTINAQSNKPKDLHQKLVENPSEYLRFLNAVVQEEVERRRVEIVATHGGSGTISVGFCGYFGDMKRTPRDLSSQDLNCLVQVEGVVLRANDFNQKIATSVHYNTKTETFVERSYRSQLSLELDNSNLPTVNVMPTKDAQGNPLRTEHGMCTYEDVQMIMLQETPEGAPVGSLPRSVSVCFEKDLVGQCQPGDRVRIVGIYLPHSEEGKDFDTILLANNVEVIGKTTSEYDLTEGDLQNCKKIAARSDPLSLLAKSVAPSVHGLDNIKKAVILMLLGGVEKDIDGHHIRGDIHLLMVGEPATAKSQILRFVMNLAPICLSTTGKGSSGVGLTGAVTTDPDTGDKQLAAGAMCLADRGVLCIDEFDKMGDHDRVTMHEAMEQGSVTIAKAGIHATLHARCSVLAAANPVLGFYMTQQSVAYNVSLPDSLLSRFDLLFIVLDERTSEHTRKVGSHVIANHMNLDLTTVIQEKNGKSNKEKEEQLAKDSGEPKPSTVWDRQKPAEKKDKRLSLDFVKKYIQHARQLRPSLTESATEYIRDRWVDLREKQRQQQQEGTRTGGMYVSPRTLECLVRLSQAHAKCRLADETTEADVQQAVQLVNFSLSAQQEAEKAREKQRREAMDGALGKRQQDQQQQQQQQQAPAGAPPGGAPVDDPAAKRRRGDAQKPLPPAPAPTSGGDARILAALSKILTAKKDEGIMEIDPVEMRAEMNQELGLRGPAEVTTREFNSFLETQKDELGILIGDDDQIVITGTHNF